VFQFNGLPGTKSLAVNDVIINYLLVIIWTPQKVYVARNVLYYDTTCYSNL